ncbi:hypothetical protein OG876_00970 [Kribbella sp. NBC_00359]
MNRSKPNNARRCSMAVYGNRMKARRHHQRTADGHAPLAQRRRPGQPQGT